MNSLPPAERTLRGEDGEASDLNIDSDVTRGQTLSEARENSFGETSGEINMADSSKTTTNAVLINNPGQNAATIDMPMLQMQKFLSMMSQAITQGQGGLPPQEAAPSMEPPVKKPRLTAPSTQVAPRQPPCPSDSEEEGEVSPHKQDSFEALDKLLDNMEGEGDSDEDGEAFRELQEFFKRDEKKGPPVDKRLAEVIAEGLKSPTNQEKIKSLVEAYPAPENLSLCVPRVNSEMWNRMQPGSRSNDLKLQNVQMGVLTALIATTQLMNSWMGSGEALSPKEMKIKTSHIIQLLSHAHLAISSRRKELIKPELGHTYKQLCGPNNPSTELLFGDNLAAKMKDMEDTANVTRKMAGYSYKGQPQKGSGFSQQQSSQHGGQYNSYRGKGGPRHPNKSTKQPFLRQQPYPNKGKGQWGRRNQHQNNHKSQGQGRQGHNY